MANSVDIIPSYQNFKARCANACRWLSRLVEHWPLSCCFILIASIANSKDPYQTAPQGGSNLIHVYTVCILVKINL